MACFAWKRFGAVLHPWLLASLAQGQEAAVDPDSAADLVARHAYEIRIEDGELAGAGATFLERRVVEHILAEAQQAEATRNLQDKHFIGDAEFAGMVGDLVEAFRDSEDERARFLVETVAKSSEIYGYYAAGDRAVLPVVMKRPYRGCSQLMEGRSGLQGRFCGSSAPSW